MAMRFLCAFKFASKWLFMFCCIAAWRRFHLMFSSIPTPLSLSPHTISRLLFFLSLFIVFAFATKFAVHYQVVLNIQFTQNVVNICHKHSNDVYDFRYHFGSYATAAPLLLLLRFMKSQRILQSLFSTSIIQRTYS